MALGVRSRYVVTAIATIVAASVALTATDALATYPGANGKIAFVSDRDGDEDIYLMNSDGTGPVQLTNHPARDFDPTWSPDGARIAFASGRDGNDELYVMNADGSGVTRLTNNPGEPDHYPAWSPDASRLTLTSGPGGNQEVFAMNADGTGRVNLTNAPRYDGRGAWSPNGSKITFYIHRIEDDYYVPDLYVMNPDGSGQTRITSDSVLGTESAWSPNGSRVLFDCVPGPLPGYTWELCTMNPDGSGVVWVTDNEVIDMHPAWSPDGTKIAYASNQSGQFEIYAMNPDGSGQVALTNDPAVDTAPDWQPLPDSDGDSQPDNDSDGLTDALEQQVFESDPGIADTDSDGCRDGKELASNPPGKGGRRNPTYVWDLLDVPDGTLLERNGAITGGDIAQVVGRFGSNDTGPGPFDRASDPLMPSLPPLLPPGSRQNYHPAFDRGGTTPGFLLHPNPPDGSIGGGDIALVVSQFGHNCTE